jgi:deazaflavin-dependent oxidoreductase (nitroreductase family)
MGKTWGKRLLGRTLRLPAALDRPGLRWALQGLSPAPVLVLTHRGRRSGKIYKTPVEALTEDEDTGEIILAPMFGENSDWYRNVSAGGLIEVSVKGEEAQPMEWRLLSLEERRAANAAYSDAHPLYSRLILRMVASVNDIKGDDLVEAVARTLPMLALKRTGSSR